MKKLKASELEVGKRYRRVSDGGSYSALGESARISLDYQSLYRVCSETAKDDWWNSGIDVRNDELFTDTAFEVGEEILGWHTNEAGALRVRFLEYARKARSPFIVEFTDGHNECVKYAKRIHKPVEEKPMTEKSNIDAAVEWAKHALAQDIGHYDDTMLATAKGILEMHEALNTSNRNRDELWCRAIVNNQYTHVTTGHLTVDVEKLLKAFNKSREELPPKKVWTAGDVAMEDGAAGLRTRTAIIQLLMSSTEIKNIVCALIAADRNERGA